jgi:hypothetical protein
VREALAHAQGLWALGSFRSPRTCRAGEQWSPRGSKPLRVGVYGSQHGSCARDGKTTAGRPRSEPAWGKPTVRDRRGACGNVDHGGTRTPPRLAKERVLATLRLKLCAPQIYPDRLHCLGEHRAIQSETCKSTSLSGQRTEWSTLPATEYALKRSKRCVLAAR